VIIIKKILKKIINKFGINISIYGTYPEFLLHHKIELLFDVGANSGQYAMHARDNGYKGKIVSFEPLPDAYEKILKNSKKDLLWTVHNRCVLGSGTSEMEINISQNSQSSSMLSMLDSHSSAAPESCYIGKTKTDVITLDSVFDGYRKNNEKILLKIDVQGFESEVLKGLALNLKNIFAVEIELSVVPLYEKQELYDYFFSFFEKNGFTLWSLVPLFKNPETGKLLQFDAIFIKKKLYF
jgi:FkbM family methyltransferase